MLSCISNLRHLDSLPAARSAVRSGEVSPYLISRFVRLEDMQKDRCTTHHDSAPGIPMIRSARRPEIRLIPGTFRFYLPRHVPMRN